MTSFTAMLHGLTQALSIVRSYSMVDWALRTGSYLREYENELRTQIPDIADIVRGYSADLQVQPSVASPEETIL